MMRLLLALLLPTLLAAQQPALPSSVPATALPTITRTIRVPAGAAALQAALGAAQAGDELVLDNAAEYVGNFVLPAHSGVVVLRSAVVPTGRVQPTATLATIATGNSEAALRTAPGASGWRVVGVRLVLKSGAVDNYGVVKIGIGDESAAADLPSNVTLDRVVVSAGDNQTSRCVALNGSALAVVDSWLADCHAKGRDAQAIGGWTGSGPYLISNNHLEGSGQAVMFGGSDPRIAGMTPSDITIRNNHLYKPLSWGGGRWTIKAAFELKHARRVLFEGNVIENHWTDAQAGFAVLFQAANQDGGAPWSHIADVTVRSNRIQNTTSGINILSRVVYNGTVVDQPMRRVLLTNNLFVDVGRDPISGAGGGRFAQVMHDHEDVQFSHNTFVGSAGAAVLLDGAPSVRFILRDNLFGQSEYGIIGTGTGIGSAALTKYAPAAIVTGNAFAAQVASQYPAGNTFPATLTASDFTNATAGNYGWKGGTAGVDGAAVLLATAGVVSGAAVTPPPVVTPPAPVTCDGHPVGYAVLTGGLAYDARRTERTTVVKGGACLGVITLASSTRYVVHIRTSSGWRSPIKQYSSRAAAESAIVAANGQ